MRLKPFSLLLAARLRAGLLPASLLAGLVLPAALAAAPLVIQPGSQVGSVKLGVNDGVLKKNPFGLALSTSGKDTEYEGQTVYYYFYGPKDANNNHPLQVYSDVNHKVFIFEINGTQFRTPQGLGVGSPEAALLKAHGPQLKKQQRGKIYTKYSLGGRQGTDFYVRQGKISQILVRAY
ncbi:MAG: hypothetical protein ACO1RX_13350 [Candidatus Sericytochromatia bacterium]